MDDLRPPPAPADPRRSAGRSVYRKDGEYWTIVYEAQAIRMKDAKGLHCLSQLLRNPGREFHATDLVGAGGTGASEERAVGAETAGVPDLGDAGEALDLRAKAEYRRRLEGLREELAEAERFNDPGRAGRARDEMEAISRQLAAGIGLGGRDRPAASHAERARVAVTQRLKSVMAKIRESHPSLGRHLAATVKTGYFCSYNPDPAERVSWDDSASLPSSGETSRSVERKLAAILSADVKDYSRLMADNEVATIQTLTAYRRIMTALVEERGGRVVDSPGDNLLAEFARPSTPSGQRSRSRPPLARQMRSFRTIDGWSSGSESTRAMWSSKAGASTETLSTSRPGWRACLIPAGSASRDRSTTTSAISSTSNTNRSASAR
jgi:hypothetical protein